MIRLNIPNHPSLNIEHLVLDYNGTLALGGQLLPGVAQQLSDLSGLLQIHVITADTFGTASQALASLPLRVSILPPGEQTTAKANFIHHLGANQCAAIGNGRNDRLLLETAALGIVVIQGEGAAVQTLLAADVVAPSINVALDLLHQPQKLKATLRG